MSGGNWSSAGRSGLVWLAVVEVVVVVEAAVAVFLLLVVGRLLFRAGGERGGFSLFISFFRLAIRNTKYTIYSSCLVY